jgi:hypothetical protein
VLVAQLGACVLAAAVVNELIAICRIQYSRILVRAGGGGDLLGPALSSHCGRSLLVFLPLMPQTVILNFKVNLPLK